MTRKDKINRTVSCVEPGSIADEVGVVAGDILLKIDGRDVEDVFDYRLRELKGFLTLEFEQVDGTISTVEVEKDENEEIGLVFTEPLMDQPRACSNQCVFCFIDQLPKGMRPSLYFKDDDPRLCFMDGNFITLTNIDDAEYERLLSYRLSPLNVSVHTTDSELRKKMLRNRCAGNVMDRLKMAVTQGISINCQIVLCPGINDGQSLERTILDLIELGEALLSIAVVPVGLTRYRDENGLPDLIPYECESAGEIVDYVHRRQRELLRTHGRRILYAADEFYIRAGRPIPPAARYDDFFQLENGVGLLAARRRELRDAVARLKRSKRYKQSRPAGLVEAGRYLLISGTDAAAFIAGELNRALPVLAAVPEVLPVPNRFFGENVTVTGLLTGRDIRSAVIERVGRSLIDTELQAPRGILLPDVTLRAGEDVFLDDMTVGELADGIGLPVIVFETTGSGLVEAMVGIGEIPEIGARNVEQGGGANAPVAEGNNGGEKL